MNAVDIATIASPIVALLVGAAQVGVIVWGLREMRNAAKDRTKQVDAQTELLAEIGKGIREQSAGLRETVEHSRATRELLEGSRPVS